MAITSNWLTEAKIRIACVGNIFSSLQMRNIELANNIEALLERDPSIFDPIPTGYSLLQIYNRIKCGEMLSSYEVEHAKAYCSSINLRLTEEAPISVNASGTAYTLTATQAAIDFGTTDPSITIANPGKYLISARVQVRLAGATFAATKEVTTKLRRTNVSAADITGSSSSVPTGVTTTQTGLLAVFNLPEVFYETSRSDDVIKLFSAVETLPSAGSVQITEASIMARRI